MGQRITLVQHDSDGTMVSKTYHDIKCLEDGWVYGAMKGSAPVQGHYRAHVLDALPLGMKPCSHCVRKGWLQASAVTQTPAPAATRSGVRRFLSSRST